MFRTIFLLPFVQPHACSEGYQYPWLIQVTLYYKAAAIGAAWFSTYKRWAGELFLLQEGREAAESSPESFILVLLPWTVLSLHLSIFQHL